MTLTLVERIQQTLPTDQQHLAQEILDAIKPYWLERVGKLQADKQLLEHKVQLLCVDIEVAKKFCCKCGAPCGIIN